MQQRARIWNGYLAWKLPQDFRHHIRNVGNPPFNQYNRGEPLQLATEEMRALDALADKHGGHPSFSNIPKDSQARFMDFSNHVFDGDHYFAGRILIRASFSRANFAGLADFSNATFVGAAGFKHTVFRKRPRFDSAVFENSAYFKGATFTETTVFNKAEFKVSAYFDDSKFLPIQGANGSSFGGVGFVNSVFAGEVSFQRAVFNVRANFEGARFQDHANFRNTLFDKHGDFQRVTFDRTTDFTSAKFMREVRFHDSTFMSTTYFRNAVFMQPPKFFGTELHEDTDLSGIKWRRAESFYASSWWSKITPRRSKSASRSSLEKPESDVVDASSAIQAWDRLTLIMSKLEKVPERHEFHRLRMRAQRRRDGVGVLSFANWVFEISCDYGWSVKRALIWWILHVVGVAFLIFCYARIMGSASWDLLLDSLSVSFSNAHAFFRLTSEGGYLYEARQRLGASVLDTSVLSIVGTVQTVIGPILLFLLLLTLRNRFRLR